MLAMNQCYFWALNNNNSTIAWVSPIYKQAKKVFDEMCKAFDGTQVITKNSSELIIKCINGSTIQFFSAERYDNIRGFTFDYLVCDEFAFFDERAWTEVLRATVLVKGKKVLLISTPKGKNFFYTMFNLDAVNDNYKSFKMTSYDGLALASEIDEARYTLPKNVFEQEYLAEFIDAGTGVFEQLTLNSEIKPSEKYYAGIDVGRLDDYTVLSIFNQHEQMVFCERWRQDSWDSIVGSVVENLKKYNAYTYIEVNSIGDVVFDLIKKKYNKIEPFVTSSKSKQDAIEALQVGIQNKSVTFLPIDWLKKEFEVFEYQYSQKSRSVKYSAPNGFHDDGVMSVAIAYNRLKNSSKTFFQFE